MLTRDLKVIINKKEVMDQIDCREGNELYEEIEAEYENILEHMYSLCEPEFLAELSTVGKELAGDGLAEGTPVIMALYSIGNGISLYSTKCFQEGDYVKGLLSDAMADSALFSLDRQVIPYLKQICAENKMGISRRIEAPKDIPMRAQKIILEATKADKLCGIGISEGYMLDPVKSNAMIYVLTEDEKIFSYEHDCRKCDRYDCKRRNVPDVPVRVSDEGNIYSVMVKERQSILDAIMLKDTSFTAVCGGTGKCGKCKIQVTEGFLPITLPDERCFSKEQLENGMRLACQAYPQEPVSVALKFKGEKNFHVVSDYENDKKSDFAQSAASEDELGIAIDIGTTTVAVQLLNLTKKEKIFTYTSINHQRSFGADVISRIKASTEGKKEELKESIRKDLLHGIRQAAENAGAQLEKITEIAIAGNTTMIHLLMGYDCKTLGEVPFRPVNIRLIEEGCENILGDGTLKARVRVLPGASVFVGGDIVSGLYYCDIDKADKYFLFLDLGTNGEIALGNKEKIMVTSTAAGPAFEGGNIKWGVGSIEGAIAGVNIDGPKVKIRTIGDKAPTGICGTGVIETVSELVRTGLVDETGCLDDEYFDEGFPIAKTLKGEEIIFTQQDVREIQLAKSAVRAGTETLILRYGIKKEDISHVYIAGGFGFKLDCKKAIEIGMIPEEFKEKIEAVGNSSLGGAVKCLLSGEDGWERCSAIGDMSDEIELSSDKDFNNFYMDYMYFEKG